ncbi:MAG: hypothetical protein A2991_01205 [Candidatus Terrybacteria bacterium RIFCSPLOWO2_01_FULL_58_14]|uniref:Uncharacterized protein n=1 Tax=Candidatus Terrybacteria bacterium RIFCSPLOWO2_01_FULL_58_14 TaxID=1802369 RepID=A0A1G2Q2I5_9BACT|nr:MAG: hypothetical protein A2991_01205 [Candidatus Terrybacteria bacterium RIFCSPLOWO2_01_FULL_58_14]
MREREFRKHLAIERDVVALQAGNEGVIRDAVRAGSRVDADIPERPKVPFSAPSVAVLIGPGLHECLLGRTRSGFAAPAIALRPFEQSFALPCFGSPSFDSRHANFPSERLRGAGKLSILSRVEGLHYR